MWHDGIEVGKKNCFAFSICMSDDSPHHRSSNVVLMPQQTERGGFIVHPTVIFSGVRLFQMLQLT
jgi:hypothetical protein